MVGRQSGFIPWPKDSSTPLHKNPSMLFCHIQFYLLLSVKSLLLPWSSHFFYYYIYSHVFYLPTCFVLYLSNMPIPSQNILTHNLICNFKIFYFFILYFVNSPQCTSKIIYIFVLPWFLTYIFLSTPTSHHYTLRLGLTYSHVAIFHTKLKPFCAHYHSWCISTFPILYNF